MLQPKIVYDEGSSISLPQVLKEDIMMDIKYGLNIVFIFLLFHRAKSGSILLYSRRKVRYRRDGYCWKKRKDGKTTREDHMKLKVQGTEVCVQLQKSQL